MRSSTIGGVHPKPSRVVVADQSLPNVAHANAPAVLILRSGREKLARVSSKANLDQAHFPVVPKEARPRSLYFKMLAPLDRAMLQEHGYAPLCLLELPRGTPEQEVAYLMAKVQGIEEGTVIVSESEVKALELEMKAYNLLSQKHMVVRFNFSDKQKGKSLAEVFDSWGQSRHTLRGNSTIAGMQLPELRRQALPTGQGKRPKGAPSPATRKNRK